MTLLGCVCERGWEDNQHTIITFIKVGSPSFSYVHVHTVLEPMFMLCVCVCFTSERERISDSSRIFEI